MKLVRFRRARETCQNNLKRVDGITILLTAEIYFGYVVEGYGI